MTAIAHPIWSPRCSAPNDCSLFAPRIMRSPATGFASLKDQHWIAFPAPRDIAAEHVFGLFNAHGFGEVTFTPVDSLTAQKRLVEAGFGLALMPENNIAEELGTGTVRTIRVDDLSAGAPVYAVTRKGGYLSAAAQAMCELLVRDYGAAFAGRSKAKWRAARRRR
jgi:DNA-binding transcriptional LysR family regulator